LPQAVRAKLDNLRDAGKPLQRLERHHFKKKENPGGPGSAFFGGMIISVVAGWIAGAIFNTTVGMVIGLTLGLLFLAATVSALRDEANGQLLTEDDRVLLAEATTEMQLIPLEDLEPLVRNSAGFIASLTSEPFGTERIELLLAAALNFTHLIPHTQAWKSSHLDSHRVQLDLDEEADQIVQHALALRMMTNRLGSEPRGNTPAAKAALNAYTVARQPLDLVWDRLVERVAALEEYTHNLLHLDSELTHAASARRSLSLDDDLGELLANAVGDEFASSHLRNLSDQSRALSAAINELVDALNGDLQTLMALEPVKSDLDQG
jgi:F0F1-type ATP synthase assembly protein I